MKKKEFKIDALEGLKTPVRDILLTNPDVVLLNGELGVGKTTFVGEFIKDQFGKDKFDKSGFMSPTYSILNEYTFGSELILHYDLYRLKPNEMDEEEIIERVSEAKISFIEWVGKKEGLKENLINDFKVVEIDIRFSENNSRNLTMQFLN